MDSQSVLLFRWFALRFRMPAGESSEAVCPRPALLLDTAPSYTTLQASSLCRHCGSKTAGWHVLELTPCATLYGALLVGWAFGTRL